MDLGCFGLQEFRVRLGLGPPSFRNRHLPGGSRAEHPEINLAYLVFNFSGSNKNDCRISFCCCAEMVCGYLLSCGVVASKRTRTC